MDTQSIATTMFLILGIVCFILAARAFYIYMLSHSDALFVIGLAMATIGLAVFWGYAKDVHLVTYNTKWAWYVGCASGGLFLVINSLMKSNEQLSSLKRWQLIATVPFILILVLTPLLPDFTTPYVPAAMNIVRSLIYVVGFARFVMLYVSKKTRFTMLMSIGFLLVGLGFGTLTPQIFQPDLAFLIIIASSLRIVGYSTLLAAYTVG